MSRATVALDGFWCMRCKPGHQRWTWDVLRTLYGQPDRHYHTLQHVASLITLLLEMGCDLAIDMDAAILAAYWHDAVYVPGCKDNEILSAGMLASILSSLKPTQHSVILGVRSITATHDYMGPCDGDMTDSDRTTVHAFIDADMSILGASPADYDLYVEQVRAEYARFDDAAWKAGRSKFLRTELEKDSSYFLDWSKGRFDDQARKNMTRELEKLGG